MKNFVTPHCHVQSLDSASTPEAFVKREQELGTGAITCTDHGTMGVCRHVYTLAKKAKLTPILGLEGYFRDDNCPILTAGGIPKDDKGTFAAYRKYMHVTIHFLDQEAYETGVRILSRAPTEKHGQERKPIFNWADLEELGSKNVTVGSGCMIGMVQSHLKEHGRGDLARQYYERLRSTFKPGNFLVEVFPHVCDRYWKAGVSITYEGGRVEEFAPWKNLKTNVGPVKAKDLAELWRRGNCPHETVFEVMENRRWVVREGQRIAQVDSFEGFIFNECQPWMGDNPDLQAGLNRWMNITANRYGDPVICSDDSHYTSPDEYIVQNVRLLAGGGSWRFPPGYHRQTSEEALAHFRDTLGTDEKQFEAWVENSHVWAERFKGFTFKDRISLPTKFYPQETLAHVKKLIDRHGRMRWDDGRYVERLKQELELLHRNGKIDLLPYFFVAEEVCQLYQEAGLLTGPGRGSAAGVLLAYLLGITHANPLEYDLSLDRFITLDRINSGKLPDIDQDLPNRDLAVKWLESRFKGHFAQLSVDTTLKLRSSVKDVARVLNKGQVPPDIEQLTKKFLNAPQGVEDAKFVLGYTDDSGDYHKGSVEYDKALQIFIQKYPKEWDAAKKCLGLTRQKGRHACAYAITDEPIANFIPLMKVSDVEVTQYTAKSVEQSGAVKMDYLVVNSLNDIADCIKLVQKRASESNCPYCDLGAGTCSTHQFPLPGASIELNGELVPNIRIVPLNSELFDVYKLPDDPAVFEDINACHTETVFQFNTPGARQWLREFKVHSVMDMSAFTALDRPGPLDVRIAPPEGGEPHNALVEYARRSAGHPWANTLPIFNELLPETHGIMVYQEQLQRCYQVLTGCTGPEAEQFRSDVAKKQKHAIEKAEPFFLERAGAKIGPDQAREAWEFFLTWAAYGFNKSHAVCYAAKLGYACAWLKHYYPLEWWTAVLRNADKNEINLNFWGFCGHLIDLPDVSLSGDRFEVQGTRIRAPISLLNGIGEKAHQQLIAGRPYKDIDDFCQKIEAFKVSGGQTLKKTKKVKVKVEGQKEKVEVEQEVEVFQKARSALGRGVVYRLIVSGTMDSLFEPGMATSDKLMAYEAALARATGAKSPSKVKDKFVFTNELATFQMRKQILPAYSAPLFPVLAKMPDTNLVVSGDLPAYEVVDRDGFPNSLLVVNPIQLQDFEEMKPWSGSRTVAVCAYVKAVRAFSYQGTKSAVEYTLDFEGTDLKVVKWGGNRRLTTAFTGLLVGSIVIAILTKFAEDRPFSLDEITVVQAPLASGEEEADD